MASVHSVKIFANGTKAENCTINCINNCNNEQYNKKLNKTKPGKYKQWILFSVWSAHKLGTKLTSTKVAIHLNLNAMPRVLFCAYSIKIVSKHMKFICILCHLIVTLASASSQLTCIAKDI